MPEFKENQGFKMKGFALHQGTAKYNEATSPNTLKPTTPPKTTTGPGDDPRLKYVDDAKTTTPGGGETKTYKRYKVVRKEKVNPDLEGKTEGLDYIKSGDKIYHRKRDANKKKNIFKKVGEGIKKVFKGKGRTKTKGGKTKNLVTGKWNVTSGKTGRTVSR
tara:strand:+ start:748 stop:1230 length:483 start_codon:yes stop_codon:yes gene_type:complete